MKYKNPQYPYHIPLPADVMSIVEKEKHAYIHANDVVYYVIEEKEFQNKIAEAHWDERKKVLEELKQLSMEELTRELASKDGQSGMYAEWTNGVISKFIDRVKDKDESLPKD